MTMNNQLSDDLTDVSTIATAFGNANDEDNMNAMNVQSSKNAIEVQKLYYYVVPADWMRRAWPYLRFQTEPDGGTDWRIELGQIECANLVGKDAVQQFVLREDVTHGVDYVLLGSRAWFLLKNKFGNDLEVAFPVVFHDSPGSVIAVRLSDSLYIPIPSTGRFPYEKYIQQQQQPGSVSSRDNSVSKTASEAADNLNDRLCVSDDETAAEDDMLPEAPEDDRMSLDQINDDNRKIFLLLPSSTIQLNGFNPQSDECGNNYSGYSNGNNAHKVISERFKYGSGLSNLGNTCFMNSSLQCLAHTGPLQRYFLTGEYLRDLNRENPLGTGGELAIKFADLMAELWGTNRRDVIGVPSYTSSTTVYPRDFKITLGKHAEQFVGYDQHDSQELATYLLDALHEDTNRVTKKPFIEKPEQEEEETDEQAADKAWELHLKREDSRIVENFVGQVKSRVQCCEGGCGRVSTTFDPFMYLSVPVPGSNDKTIEVTFVPFDPTVRPIKVAVTLMKTASFSDLLQKIKDILVKREVIPSSSDLPLEDLVVADVWNNSIHSFHGMKAEVDSIRDTDTTFVYQLRPLNEIRQAIEEAAKTSDGEFESVSLPTAPKSKRFKLDVATLKQLNQKDWMFLLAKYMKTPLSLNHTFNKKRGTAEGRIKLYEELVKFIDTCNTKLDCDEKDIEGEEKGVDSDDNLSNADEHSLPELKDCCQDSLVFEKVKTRHDLAVIGFAARKMRSDILQMEKDQKTSYPDGIVVQIYIRKSHKFGSSDNLDIPPLLVRIPSSTTVYGLRKEMSLRLARCLQAGAHFGAGETGPSTFINNGDEQGSKAPPSSSFGDPNLLLLRQVPLTYERHHQPSYKSTTSNITLGSLEKDGERKDDGKNSMLASSIDEAENENVAERVGDRGSIYMSWPSDLFDRVFDLQEYKAIEVDESFEAVKSPKLNGKSKVVTVQDCIEKFCQMEQLEESEMWYCNRCKQHVRAWKQFHIYRSPPILIVHLKRFMFSSTSLRRDKINMFVDFPLKGLDLTNQVMHYNEGEEPIYDCYAVSNHYGGLGGGHYTAYALNDDGVWCYYDDSRITTNVSEEEVVSMAAYILYYRRRDVRTDMDFLENIQTPMNDLSPKLVQESHDRITEGSDMSSSNVAMVGDDEQMEVDDNDFESCPTSPIGSVNGDQDDYDTERQSPISHSIISDMPLQ